MGISLRPEHLKRYRDLAVLIAKYGRPGLVRQIGLDEAIEETALTGESERDAKALGKALAGDLETMGPTYIKLGQLLSTRYDMLPDAYCDALARLQDDVAPFPFEEVEQIVTAEVGLRMSKAFSEFDSTPIAAASLGQVHRARLRDGREVAVKVQRPGIRKTIADDLDALQQVADWIDEHTDFGRRHHLRAMLDEFRKSLVRELDYRREAQNLVTLGKNLAEFELIIVPKPIDDYTTDRVLTMEYVRGIKITKLSDVAKLELPGKQLADQLFRAYLQQILIDGFFHADPHPGNVFVMDDHRVALLDLGQVGYIAPQLQAHLTQLVFAISEGRSDDVVTYALRISEKTPAFDAPGFSRAVADIVATQKDRTLAQVQVGKIVLAILEVSGRYGLIVAPDLAMLGKALLNLDQVGYMLDPSFSPNDAIRESAAEIMQRRMAQSLSPGHLFQNMIEMKDFLERMPGRVNRILDAIANNEVEVKVHAIDENKLLSGFQKIANRITMGLLMAALIVGAAMLIRVPTSFQLFGYPGIAIIFFSIAAIGALALMLQILRDDRST
ncbi:MAG TPA: AarF/UbiB family protein [Candidatus Limnocylindria bacterium]|jgi:predicted unusual protein kinase regulating ubiquinone biosynthesis (AarF/ABC1/UbiB family)|nr:AarF/UbiB family protein [Candidatus Limnocylindria bacterium]